MLTLSDVKESNKTSMRFAKPACVRRCPRSRRRINAVWTLIPCSASSVGKPICASWKSRPSAVCLMRPSPIRFHRGSSDAAIGCMRFLWGLRHSCADDLPEAKRRDVRLACCSGWWRVLGEKCSNARSCLDCLTHLPLGLRARSSRCHSLRRNHAVGRENFNAKAQRRRDAKRILSLKIQTTKM